MGGGKYCTHTQSLSPLRTLFSARRSKTNISLVPRAVTRKTESAPGNQQAPGSDSGLVERDSEESKVTKMYCLMMTSEKYFLNNNRFVAE